MPVGKQSLTGNYSWDDARHYYFLALTNDEGKREHNFGETFRALGQLMHMVEDMSSPAHTRNDGHLFGDGYETWAGRFVKAGDVPHYSPIHFEPNDSYSLTVRALFTTDQYSGSNPEVTWQNTIGLSEYVNANFFSDGTIGSAPDHPHPVKDWTKRVYVEFSGHEMVCDRDYYYKECSGIDTCTNMKAGAGNYLLAAVDYYDWWRIQNPHPIVSPPITPTLDENVYSDYAQLLMPRAIGYSADLLRYFFRGKMKVKILPVFNADRMLHQVYVAVRNVTTTKETMDGTDRSYFVLSYRYTPPGAPSDGSGDTWVTVPVRIRLPKPLPFGLDDAGNDLEGDDYEALLVFDNLDQLPDPVPEEHYDRLTFMLTYVGDLGEEKIVLDASGDFISPGAVIGKHVPASKPIFSEEWSTSPDGDNRWYHSRSDGSSLFCDNWTAGGADNDGMAETLVQDGRLVKNNIRYQSGCGHGHCNTSMIGWNSLSGDTYNPANDEGNAIFPIPVTENTYIEFKIDEMSINPVPAEDGVSHAYHILEFNFTDADNQRYTLQLSLGGQAMNYGNPALQAGYFTFEPGVNVVDNIHRMFKVSDIPIPYGLRLNSLFITQQIVGDLACDSTYQQRTVMDFIRVVEMSSSEPQ